jgi:endonuclease/exonuclease/phosphatase family metal-dependent hydrolase
MQIRLGTLNAWGLPAPLARDTDHRIDAIGQKLLEYDLDVLAFQEVWTKQARVSLQRAGKRAGLVHSWAGEGASWAPGRARGGLLILSRLPIEAVRFESFTLRGEPERAVANLEYVSGKGFVAIELRTPEGPFALINTHLHARYKTRTHNYVPHRTGQAIQLAARHAVSEMPLVVVGDFNFRENEPDYRVLTGLLGLRDTAVELESRQDTTLTSNPYRKSRFSRRKDYIFVRDGASRSLAPQSISRAFDAPLRVDGRDAAYSNHAGLIVDFEIGGAANCAARADDPSIFALAADLLDVGKQLAKDRRTGERQLSGLGVGVAALAGLTMLPKPVSRRRMLRMSLGASALAALTPGVGFSLVSEVLVQDEIAAFKQAAEQLAKLQGLA